MKVEIKIPSMGESITEATVGAIFKPTGSKVSMDEEILELETDKVNQVLYAPVAGMVNLAVAKDETVRIGQVIGHVEGQGGGEKSRGAKEEMEPSAQSAPKEAPFVEEGKHQVRLPKESILAYDEEKKKESKPGEERELSPKSAEKKEVKDPEPKRSEEKDLKVETFSSQKGRRETRRRMTKLRRVIAERLVEAQKTAAMLTTFNEVDLTQVMELRTKYKDYFQKEYGVKLGFMSFFIKAAVSALSTFPDVNSYIDGEDIVHREYYDIGVAVGTEKGLIVPVVRNCDKLSFAEIERSIEEFARKAREGKISIDDLQGGSFTITNGGVYGSLLSTPILNPPQSGILGMHKIEKRPVVVNDEIVIRPMMYLAMSYDHRIIDGKEAVSFLIHVKNGLEDPSRLLLGV